MGMSAIQLAKAVGVETIAVAGVKNHDLVRSLGAGAVFDHADANVVDKIVDTLSNKEVSRSSGSISTFLDNRVTIIDVLNAFQGHSLPNLHLLEAHRDTRRVLCRPLA